MKKIKIGFPLIPEQLEEKAYVEQEKYIEEEFGKKAAKQANYGWGVDENDSWEEIATKIYQHGILSTTINFITGEIDHEFEPFD